MGWFLLMLVGGEANNTNALQEEGKEEEKSVDKTEFFIGKSG